MSLRRIVLLLTAVCSALLLAPMDVEGQWRFEETRDRRNGGMTPGVRTLGLDGGGGVRFACGFRGGIDMTIVPDEFSVVGEVAFRWRFGDGPEEGPLAMNSVGPYIGSGLGDDIGPFLDQAARGQEGRLHIRLTADGADTVLSFEPDGLAESLARLSEACSGGVTWPGGR